ncbi:hypothetical protein SEVIR_1G233601v4 [Setaria viridis]
MAPHRRLFRGAAPPRWGSVPARRPPAGGPSLRGRRLPTSASTTLPWSPSPSRPRSWRTPSPSSSSSSSPPWLRSSSPGCSSGVPSSPRTAPATCQPLPR